MPKREFFGSLESLRGIAALLVVLYHIGRAPNGHAAVEFFFVLSGFVLHHSYGGRIPDRTALKRFLVLRLQRIYPVHLAFTLAFFAIEVSKYIGTSRYKLEGLQAHHALSSIVRDFFDNLLLIQGLGLRTREVFLNFPSWSISTEFYTYVIFGLATFLLSRRKFLVFSLLLSATAALALALVGTRIGEFQQMLRCVAGFFLGCLTREAYGLLKHRVLRVDWGSLLLLLMAVGLCLEWHGDAFSWLVGLPASSLLVLALVLAPSSRTHTLLLSRPLRWLGRISYSLYMCHALVLYVIRDGARILSRLMPGLRLTDPGRGVAALEDIATVGAVVIGGWLTYVSIEGPAKKWFKARADAAVTRLAAARIQCD
jgi:peptidoglycan/LPS O-acetylase OafA/YrhL